MKNQDRFGVKPSTPGAVGNSSGSLDCAAIELLWSEAVEGALTADVAEQVRAHTAGCASCREKLAQARSGREWLLLLKQEPLEPPSDIVARILARTSLAPDFASHRFVGDTMSAGEKGVGDVARHSGSRHESESAEVDYISGEDANSSHPYLPAWQQNPVVVLRRTLLEPRLALVAAMAFFSIALTLNLMGVRLTNLHAADLEPQAMRRAVSRQYVEANARVVRYYENLRIVYEVESQVRQLRQETETSSQPGQTGNHSEKHAPASNRNSSRNETDSDRVGAIANQDVRGHLRPTPANSKPDPMPVVTGPVLNATFDPRSQLELMLRVFRRAPHTASYSFRERRLV